MGHALWPLIYDVALNADLSTMYFILSGLGFLGFGSFFFVINFLQKQPEEEPQQMKIEEDETKALLNMNINNTSQKFDSEISAFRAIRIAFSSPNFWILSAALFVMYGLTINFMNNAESMLISLDDQCAQGFVIVYAGISQTTARALVAILFYFKVLKNARPLFGMQVLCVLMSVIYGIGYFVGLSCVNVWVFCIISAGAYAFTWSLFYPSFEIIAEEIGLKKESGLVIGLGTAVAPAFGPFTMTIVAGFIYDSHGYINPLTNSSVCFGQDCFHNTMLVGFVSGCCAIVLSSIVWFRRRNFEEEK